MNFTSCNASTAERTLLKGFSKDPLYPDLVASLAATIMGFVGKGKIPTIAISGAQGTGKTTLVLALVTLLTKKYSKSVVNLSLDDFYLSRAARLKLAEEVHPLFRTRGVPGTHDVALIKRSLLDLREGRSAELPVFDKARDDLAKPTRLVASADIIVCEGWCWGARPQTEEALKVPINSLEEERDVGGYWRRYVNDCTKDYQSLFDQDFTIFLQAPSLREVFLWRWQQEQDLARRVGSAGTMSREQVADFIQYYERLTNWMLVDLPGRSDLTVVFDKDHRITEFLPLV